MQNVVTFFKYELKNTLSALKNKNIPQALSFLQAAQQQLSLLKNSSLIKNVSTELLQSMVSSPSSLLSSTGGIPMRLVLP